LERLGYELHEAFRRQKDAVVVGYKRERYEILRKETVDYNDIAEVYAKAKESGLDPKELIMHNKAIICQIKHVRTFHNYFLLD
jgi:hypothetical protein